MQLLIEPVVSKEKQISIGPPDTAILSEIIKGHSELLEKSPITPPDVLHDKERGKGAKKAKKKQQVDKYDPVKQLLYIDSLIFNNSYKKH